MELTLRTVQNSSGEAAAAGVVTVDAIVRRETHTLGCLLQEHLRRDPDVASAAYVQDHPLDDCMRLRVTSADPKRSMVKAAMSAMAEVDACVDACRDGLGRADFAAAYHGSCA